MEALWTSAVAVIGTLLGGVVTHVFQRRAAKENEHFSRTESLRQERIAAYSAFAGALEDFRKVQGDRWYRRQEDRNGEPYKEALREGHRHRALARQALFRVKLLAGDRTLIEAADHAFEATRNTSGARDEAHRDELFTASRTAIEVFVETAAPSVQ
ncbi:hypothetical protein [Streptomyces beijiangensis]|uniref:Uncharacterized protein n=1 Tax=Streptomyces beijiangensis TaxID=163361 RepID=A0A939FF95_9ACTN|nr:hypothetical protein [Streptomyces beijiangensis]MBO0516327.1 hypothetical protein [Streptomyces beijiangensis]